MRPSVVAALVGLELRPRRLREAARLLLRERPLAGFDLVLIGRDGTRGRPFASLLDDLERALRRTGAR